MPLGRDDEGEKEQKAKNNQGRIVGVENRPDNSQEMDGRDEGRNRLPAFVYADGGIVIETSSLRNTRKDRRVRREDPDDRLPSKFQEHVTKPPFPFAGHHNHGRRGKMGERAANRNINEEKSKCGVTERHTGLKPVESVHEEESADGHRGRFRDE